MATSDPKFTYINSMAPGIKAVNLQFIVLEIGAPTRTKDGSDVRTVKVADQSGSIDISVWNELGEALRPGDICRLKNGFTNVRKGCLNITCGRMGELMKIGEFTLAYSELPNMSAFNQELLSYGKHVHDEDEGGIPSGGNGSSDRYPRGASNSKGNGFKQQNPRLDRTNVKDEELPITSMTEEESQPPTSDPVDRKRPHPVEEKIVDDPERGRKRSFGGDKRRFRGKHHNTERNGFRRYRSDGKKGGKGFSGGRTRNPPTQSGGWGSTGMTTNVQRAPVSTFLPPPRSIVSVPPPSFNFSFPPPPIPPNPPAKRGWVKLSS